MKKAHTMCGLAIVAALTFSSCATIFGGTQHTFVVNSNPGDAKLVITNKKGKEVFNGNTPATVRLKSGAGYFSPAQYTVKFTKAGYEEFTMPIHFKLNGWYFGNILIGGAIGMLIVDPLTGGMWTVSNTEKRINKMLKPQGATEPSLTIVDVKHVDEGMKERLVKIN
ncbi:hypothetical protein [Chitinophaga filiformis]|nr:hypothetical protein [Chitinophaga filiformis]